MNVITFNSMVAHSAPKARVQARPVARMAEPKLSLSTIVDQVAAAAIMLSAVGVGGTMFWFF